MELGFTEEEKTSTDFREEMNNELNELDTNESQTHSKVAPAPLVVPEKVARGFIRVENALILSAITKDSSPAIKQAARDALEPNKEDIEIVSDFMLEVIKRYSPKTFSDPLTTAAVLYVGNLGMKITTVYGIKEGTK